MPCVSFFFTVKTEVKGNTRVIGMIERKHTIMAKCLSHDKWLTGDRLIKIGPVSLSLQPPQSTFSFCAPLSECSCSVLAPCQSISGKGADCICLMSSRQRESVFQQPRHTDRQLEDHFVCAHYAQRLITQQSWRLRARLYCYYWSWSRNLNQLTYSWYNVCNIHHLAVLHCYTHTLVNSHS